MEEKQPLLIYDGDCGFCKLCVNYILEEGSGEFLTTSSRQWLKERDGNEHYPSEDDFNRAVFLKRPDGSWLEGAHAIFWILKYQRVFRWVLPLYEKLEVVRLVSEWGYRLVAQNRIKFSKLTRFFEKLGSSAFSRMSVIQLFFLLLGICHASFFSSILYDGTALFGENGLASFTVKAEKYSQFMGGNHLSNLPSVFWFAQDNWFITLCGVLGLLFSFMIMKGICRSLFLFLSTILVLSFVNFGYPFMNFQWDTLLIETSFLALLLSFSTKRRPLLSSSILFALWSLCIKLHLSSGLVKWFASTPWWRNGEALKVHFYTQPIPNFLSIFFHILPDAFLGFCTWLVVAVQIFAPLTLFIPGKTRKYSVWILIIFQITIFVSGNYNFFNINAIALLILFLKDRDLSCIPLALSPRLRLKEMILNITFLPIMIVVIVFNSTITAGRVVKLNFNPLQIPLVQSLHLFSSYGLFSNMTVKREEIILEGSGDGKTWERVDFPWKPDFPGDCPIHIAPIQPRIDWQMWFAALGRADRNEWLIILMKQILEGKGDAISLLNLPDHNWKFIKATRYDYTFEKPSNYFKGVCWNERRVGEYTTVLTRESFR